jgi:hypothetical protein
VASLLARRPQARVSGRERQPLSDGQVEVGRIVRRQPKLPRSAENAAGGIPALVDALVGRSSSPALKQALYEAIEGNPFLVEEVLRALIEEGRLGRLSPDGRKTLGTAD